MKVKFPLYISLFLLVLSCGPLSEASSSLNLFPVSKDVELGKQMEGQIANDPKTKIIPRSKAKEAYKMLDDIIQAIKLSGKLKHKDDFSWKVAIIDADVLNAFCAPGGYMYVYTGLMKYLDSVDDLAGVMGHEMAHADQRHSTSQMTKTYGTEMLMKIVLKDKSSTLIARMGTSLFSLKYGRDDEKEADSKSVEYLCNSDYKADGAANFFKKLVAEGQNGASGLQEYFSTHPSPDSRVENITILAKACNLKPKKGVNYKRIVNAL